MRRFPNVRPSSRYRMHLSIRTQGENVAISVQINGVGYACTDHDTDSTGQVGLADYGCQIQVRSFQASAL